MTTPVIDPLRQMQTTSDSLLYELQVIWNEVGVDKTERDEVLLEIEQECLEVYRRKVDQANRNRAQLRQAIADCEADLAAICSAMGERPVHTRQSVQNGASLNEELQRIVPYLEEMKKKKMERLAQLVDVCEEIHMITKEIQGIAEEKAVNETDISLRKLEELHRELHALQAEKSDRLSRVEDHIVSIKLLCAVLGMEIEQLLHEIHPSLVSSEGRPIDITDNTIQQLEASIQRLRELKLQRMEKLQDLSTNLLELWNLMDTPVEEQQMFQNVTSKIAVPEHEITDSNLLSTESISNVEAEVVRLEQLKSSKMRELVLKKRFELEELCRKTHLVPEANASIDYSIEAIDTGSIDAENILEQLESEITKVKVEALSRKDLLEKVEKWWSARDEENWLEEYNRDENRFNAGRGAHLILKRAEKARSLVNKLPGMVEALASKTITWEKERGTEFFYDGMRLLSMLEEYTILRQEKEEDKKRQRDQKKLQGMLLTEQETLYGSKPSPSKLVSVKKGARPSTGGASNRRLSLGGALIQTPKGTPRGSRRTDFFYNEDGFSTTSDDCVEQ